MTRPESRSQTDSVTTPKATPTCRLRRLALRAAVCCTALLAVGAGATTTAASSNDVLIQFRDSEALSTMSSRLQSSGAKIESLGGRNWVHVKFGNPELRDMSMNALRANPDVLHVQPNYKLHLLEDYRATDPAVRARVAQAIKARDNGGVHTVGHPYPDNPPFLQHGPTSAGPDPDYNHQWGVIDIGASNAWKSAKGDGIVVAVIDTGVDYTHEDLVDNLWHNPGEMGKDASGKDKSSNGIDDDANGFVDDVIGWDFASNDNKPYDYSVDPMDLLNGGGNPGHGTHCAGNVAAVGNNGVGISGVAPEAKIMAVRFLNDKGEGDTATAVKAVNYAVMMGAKVLSNSWGGEGDDPSEAAANQALKDAISNAQAKNVLFVAAAGNGHQGVGYDNDTDPKPGVPASYDNANIVSVAAVDKTDQLGAFSNWGKRTVHIAAPGVMVFSTTVGSHYSDLVLDLPEYGIQAGWDGTSMATPHVAGAAALYWSNHPTATWSDVKTALINSAKAIPAMADKCVSNGKLDVEKLMMQ